MSARFVLADRAWPYPGNNQDPCSSLARKAPCLLLKQYYAMCEGPQPGWLFLRYLVYANMQLHCKNKEYHIQPLTDLKDVFQAPNRAHDLRTYFYPGHVEMTTRRADGWHWPLGLSGGRHMNAWFLWLRRAKLSYQ